MNGHAKRAKETIEALGFTYDSDASKYGKSVYRHVNSPEEVVKVWGGMAEGAARAATEKAKQIAGLSTAGPKTTATLREVARIKRQDAKAKKLVQEAREARERAEIEAALLAKKAERERAALLRERERETSAVASLMQPGYGR